MVVISRTRTFFRIQVWEWALIKTTTLKISLVARAVSRQESERQLPIRTRAILNSLTNPTLFKRVVSIDLYDQSLLKMLKAFLKTVESQIRC